MSDCMIIRRGGGGHGFDPNGAVLKVVTSTGCTVTVTNSSAGYSKTHQQADGYPRSSDADVTEHFFSIPAPAFGTFSVAATNNYGTNTKNNVVIINTAGKVYEVTCGSSNILLSSVFGSKINSFFGLSDYVQYSTERRLYLFGDVANEDYTSTNFDFTGYSQVAIRYISRVPTGYNSPTIELCPSSGGRFDIATLIQFSDFSQEVVLNRGNSQHNTAYLEVNYNTAKFLAITGIVLS